MGLQIHFLHDASLAMRARSWGEGTLIVRMNNAPRIINGISAGRQVSLAALQVLSHQLRVGLVGDL